jgi:hypothetical protein
LVVVTAAGVLLGRRDIIAGSRAVGTAFGRIVGTLHGMRTKFEQKSKGTEIYNLHSSVTHGLMDMRTIGYDLMNVSPFNQGPMMSPSAASGMGPSIGHSSLGSITKTIMTPVSATATMSPMAPVQGALPSHSQTLVTSTEDHALDRTGATNAAPDAPDVSVSRLARLILAEEELSIRLGTFNGAEAGGTHGNGGGGGGDEVCGADIIQSVVKESIISEAFNNRAHR